MQTPEFGHCVGVESSADFESDIGAPHDGGALSRRSRRLAAVHKEFPPPISWLARAENLPSHIPWVMKRYCTSDGRLIINEERVKRHDYFLADRSNGRLVLNLVHVVEVEVEVEVVEENRSPEIDEGKSDLTVEEVASECYKYNGVAALKTCACGVFVATPPMFMPPVHT